VNGPSPDKVVSNPALTTKSTKVDKASLPIARSTILLLTHDGIRTLSMAWMTPLSAPTSGTTTSEPPFTDISSPFTPKERSSPLRAAALRPSVTAEEGTSSGRT